MIETPVLDVADLHKQYPGGPGVLCGVTFSVCPGQSVAIVGPSGSGKSTLLNLISALDRPDSGTVRLDGMDLSDLRSKRLAEIRNQDIGFVFQMHHLLPQLTVRENLLVPVLAMGRVTSDARDRADSYLERVGLGGKADAYPATLSGGQRQRVAVVRALMNNPVLLLADEPTGSLDRESAEQIAELLADLNRRQETAMVVVTHSSELAAHMDRTYELRDGVLHDDLATETQRI